MGSSASSPENKGNHERRNHQNTSPEMSTITHHKVIPTSGTQPLQNTFTSPKPLKGILKNKNYEKPVKEVELYVLRGSEWQITRVREDQIEMRKKELKADKTVKRVYTKPTHDQTFLHFQPFWYLLDLVDYTRIPWVLAPYDRSF